MLLIPGVDFHNLSSINVRLGCKRGIGKGGVRGMESILPESIIVENA